MRWKPLIVLGAAQFLAMLNTWVMNVSLIPASGKADRGPAGGQCHPGRVIPGFDDCPYRRVEAWRRVMVEQSPSPGSATGIGGVPEGTANVAGSTGGSKAAGLSGGVIATLAGGGLLVVFMVQNTEDVTLQFLFWSFTLPLWLFTLIVAILGSIVWIGLGILRRHRRRKARRDARDD